MIPIVFVCGIHNKKLLPKQGRSLIYGMCPNHRAESRDENDEICNNFLSLNAINIIENDIQSLYEADILELEYSNCLLVNRWNIQRDITHKSNKPVKIFYKVMDINDDYIKISINRER